MMERQDFIDAMIQALKEESKSISFEDLLSDSDERNNINRDNNSTKSIFKMRDANAVFQALCFDFPNVSVDELATLNSECASYFEGNTSDFKWSYNSKFIENITSLATSANSSSSCVNNICALTFIIFPSKLLYQSKFYWIDFFQIDDWIQLLELFKSLISSCSAGILSQVDSDKLINYKIIENLSIVIKFFSKYIVRFETESIDVSMNNLESYLNEQFRSNCEDNENKNLLNSLIQDIITSSIFLTRDLFSSRPEIVKVSNLKLVIHAIYLDSQRNNDIQKNLNVYPNETFFLLFISGVARSICQKIHSKSLNTLYLKARIELRLFLESLLPTISYIQETLNQDKSIGHLETISLILPLATLYLLDVNVANIFSTTMPLGHDKLLSSRILIQIINSFEILIQRDFNNQGVNTIDSHSSFNNIAINQSHSQE